MRDWIEWGIDAPSPVPTGSIVDYVLNDGQTIMRYVVGTSGVIRTQQGGYVLSRGGAAGPTIWTRAIEAWRFSDDDAGEQRTRYAELFTDILKNAPSQVPA